MPETLLLSVVGFKLSDIDSRPPLGHVAALVQLRHRPQRLSSWSFDRAEAGVFLDQSAARKYLAGTAAEVVTASKPRVEAPPPAPAA
jgi:hypothetical protein